MEYDPDITDGPVAAAVISNGPYWHVDGLLGLSKIETVEPLTSPAARPATSLAESAYVIDQVPVTESPVCASDNESVPLPKSASLTGPVQLPATSAGAGAVVDFAAHAASTAVAAIMNTRCISALWLSAMSIDVRL